MRLIFSRKGFDSSAGGVPSPLIEGKPFSLPIPTRMPSGTCFRDLADPMSKLVADLTSGKISPDTPCHLDPDIDPNAMRKARLPEWRGTLGQVAAAQSHLANHGICSGDVFLFWGLFRSAAIGDSGRWQFSGLREHRIFGWLQIGEVLSLFPDPEAACAGRPWLRGHPHVREGWPANNTLYVASSHLVLGGKNTGLHGFGTLRTGYRLTAKRSCNVSEWKIPTWLDPTEGGTGMTYHPPARWFGNGGLRAAARGQEFVADVSEQAEPIEWLLNVLEDAQ